MKVSEKNILIGLVFTVLLIVLFSGMFRLKAVASCEYFTDRTDAAETEFRELIKEELKTLGAKNAGVNITKRCVDGHTYEYKVLINLPSFIILDKEREEKFTKALESIALDVENSVVDFSFS